MSAAGLVTVTRTSPAIDWTLTVPGLTPGAVHRAAATGFLGRDNAAFEPFFADLAEAMAGRVRTRA